MNTRRIKTAIAATAVLALSLSACGGSSNNSGGSSGGDTAKAEFNAAMTKVFNASDKKGGIVKFADEGAPDSVDTGDTYYGYSWNMVRLWSRSLTMFTVAPGKDSSKLVGDLAEGLGTPSDGGKTWTYKIRKGLKYEDGTPITSKDVKYGVSRSTDKTVFPDGPAYFDSMLNWPAGYKGPYKSKGMNTDSAISTPDDTTIVFHLKSAFAGFDYLAMTPQSAPVPEAKDQGAKQKQHVISSGPYMFAAYADGKSFTLKRNPNWDQASDPNRKALPDGYEMSLNVDPEDIDNRLISGDLDIASAGTGVSAASQSRVLGDPTLKARADNPTLGRLWYTSINPTVKPFDNIECRKAVEYAMDKTSYQTAYGGEFAGGSLATTLLPPVIPGYKQFDLYPTPDGKGDLNKAKESLTKCGQPNGFATNISYRNERPKEKATAEAFQQQLAKVGIKVTVKGFPKKDYFSTYAGNPPYVAKNGLGLVVNGWGADWNDGFGFLSQITDSRVIRETGGSSNTSVRIPEVDKLLDQAQGELDTAKRESDWSVIDQKVMEQAVIYPGVYAKSLLIRGKNLTNVFVNEQFGMYDYLSLGKP
ncbi:peptide/nickel transport system substrate-binding protein [Kribbella voronezhensis]|uniref:Peptide/nickel transport system substrate-binding protein n=1 Tax=Kribbella voronezhensis TaxID=2512212 RepID=A0A4R7SZP7_9ACTN|nr:ABC transporter substrate-binding protein [Kribbella voronezhensis]TDU84037.1 peptide/nickel transport system substrate-binding protein [Kribbella voronezhensis]